MIDERAKTDVLRAIAKEKENAIENHGYFHSDHEFWAVLHEEAEELQEDSTYITSIVRRLWDSVRGDSMFNNIDTLNAIRENAINAAVEAVQVAAVIDKYLVGRERTILQKWNWNKHDYEDYEVPKDWVCKCYCASIIETVNCAHCGKVILFGDSYTSTEIHTKAGLGYAVCSDCFAEECKRRQKSEGVT